jgi:hypothetical protein
MKLSSQILLFLSIILPSYAVHNSANRKHSSKAKSRSESNLQDFLKISEQAAKISEAHPGGKNKNIPNINKIPIASINAEHVTASRVDSYTRHLFTENKELNERERQFANALRDYIKPSQKELESMATDLAKAREDLGKDFRYEQEFNDIQKLRLLLKELYNENVVRKLGITKKTSIKKLKSLISSTLSSLKPSVLEGRKIINKILVKGPSRFASTNLHLAFKRWWLWDAITSIGAKLIKYVVGVAKFAFNMAVQIGKSIIKGVTNLVSAIINGNLIPSKINQNCYGFCVNGLTCNFIKMKCIPSPRGGLMNLGFSCFQNSIQNIKNAYSQFMENAKRKDVGIIDKVCASIGKPIIEGLYCVSPGLQFMSGFFKTVSIGLDLAANNEMTKGSVSFATGIKENDDSFCSIDFCSGFSLSFGTGADIAVTLTFSQGEPKQGETSTTFGLGFEIMKLGAGISVTFDNEDQFDGISFSLGTGVSTVESPLKFSVEALKCQTMKVFEVPKTKSPVKTNKAIAPESITKQGITKNFLNSGESLYAGEALVAQISDDKAIIGRLQDDCNFVVYDHDARAVFSTNTYKSSRSQAKSCKLKLEENGALNLYGDDQNVLWSANTGSDKSTYQLVLQMSGNMIIYSGEERNRHWAQL